MKHRDVILFDCYGIFAPDTFATYFATYFPQDGAAKKEAICSKADRGEYTLDEAVAKLQEDYGINPEEFLAFMDRTSVPIPDMLSFATKLREHNTVCLLSNCMEGILERNFAGFDLSKSFDRQYRSYRLHLAKPGPEIFAYVKKDLGPNVERLVFFDDNPANVEAALSAGIPAYLYTDKERCQAVLKQLGYDID